MDTKVITEIMAILEIGPAKGAYSDYPLLLGAKRLNFKADDYSKCCPECGRYQDILRIEICTREDGSFISDPIHVHVCPCGHIYKPVT